MRPSPQALVSVLIVATRGGCELNSGISAVCESYLQEHSYANPDAFLADATAKFKCTQSTPEQDYSPPAAHPSIPSADTTNMNCRFGNPLMACNTGNCCGLRPHFNWILASCDDSWGGVGQFCVGSGERTRKHIPSCMKKGQPHVNYIAAYQFDSDKQQWVLQDSSSAGTLQPDAITGDFNTGDGFEKVKEEFRYVSGDWNVKYSPACNGESCGPRGPRGLTPPGSMVVLSVENMQYGTFYFLTQNMINLDKNHQNATCWTWEFDAVEGSFGWVPWAARYNKDGSVNLNAEDVNRLFMTSNAQNSGCMMAAFSWGQLNAGVAGPEGLYPEYFRDYCVKNRADPACNPTRDVPIGGGGSSAWMEFTENVPYVIAIVFDRNGYWTYRWVPDDQGKTGWDGLGRHRAERILQATAPSPITDACGLRTEVPGNCKSSVMLQPSGAGDSVCNRCRIEQPDWQWGASALGEIAHQMGDLGRNPSSPYFGSQNWWNYFADTNQAHSSYSPTIIGVPPTKIERDSCNNWVDLMNGQCSVCPAPNGTASHTVVV